MPRIRRWHPVSHDFVRDREVQELRRRFKHWMSDVWLEMLAEADKNDGRIKGDYDAISRSLAWVSLSNRPETQVKHIRYALEYMAEKGWISQGTDCVLVRNYREYHKTREKKESHEGIKEAPSFLPSEPSLPNKNIIIKKQAIEVLAFLNEKTGRTFPATDKSGPTASLRMIMARLSNGATVENCRGVIARKARQWKDDPKMQEFLRPATLFRKTNFEQYLGERDAEVS